MNGCKWCGKYTHPSKDCPIRKEAKVMTKLKLDPNYPDHHDPDMCTCPACKPEQPCKAGEENEKYNLPCPYNPKVKCVQYPEEECGCDPCGECEIKLKASEELARKFHETYERLAPDFGYKTRKASAKPWGDVPKDNKQLMIAVCKEILQPYSVYKLELVQPSKEGEFVKEMREKYSKRTGAIGTIGKDDVLALCDIIARLEGEKKEYADLTTDSCKKLQAKIENLTAALAAKEAECERLEDTLKWIKTEINGSNTHVTKVSKIYKVVVQALQEKDNG